MILGSLIACNTIVENNMTEKTSFCDDVQFKGDQKLKKKAVELLDKVLKEQGDLGVHGDLSGGLEEITKDMYVTIKEEKKYYEIEIYPKSDSGGHDFGFTIDKKTGKRSDVVVGEVLPYRYYDN